METHILEMYKHNENINPDTYYDSLILTRKMELSRYNTLYEHYNTEFSSKYFVTCSVRKMGVNLQMCKFWLKKKCDLGEDEIHNFSIILYNNTQREKIKWFKKNKQFLSVRIHKYSNNGFTCFDLIVKPFNNLVSRQPTYILDNAECIVCYEKGKSYYSQYPFLCIHNEICVDCSDRVFNTSKCCPLCRASMNSVFVV